jgi:hypothetical protein
MMYIAQGQQTDASLLQRRMLHPLSYPSQYFNGPEMIQTNCKMANLYTNRPVNHTGTVVSQSFGTLWNT